MSIDIIDIDTNKIKSFKTVKEFIEFMQPIFEKSRLELVYYGD